MPLIDKRVLEHITDLSRITLRGKESMTDMQEIVSYVDSLRGVGAESAVHGHAPVENAVREDAYDAASHLSGEAARGAFPAERDGYLAVLKIL